MANITNLVGSAGAISPTSEVHSSQLETLGQLAIDGSGNIYQYVDFQEPCVVGEWVAISNAFAASQLTNTSRGFVGVVIGTVSASDRYGWVQVFGVHTAALGSSNITSGDAFVASATTATGGVYPATTSVGVAIFGAVARSAPDTCASTALSADAAPFTVQLNFPFINGMESNLSS